MDETNTSGAAAGRRVHVNPDALPATLLALTYVTGLVDAVSFLGLGRTFTANMTGNVVILGFAVAGTPGLSIARSLTSLIAFIAGAAIGGRVAAFIGGGTKRRWLLTVASAESALLFAAAFATLNYHVAGTAPTRSLYAVIIPMAIAMGIRNATARKLAVPDLSTTVLTQTLTGIAADSSLAGGNNPLLGRRVVSVAAMFAGAASGALLIRFGLALPLILSGLCVLMATAICAYLEWHLDNARSAGA
ncbi:MAG: DUF1275 domain-containing protein [Blastocatellia bacterium]|nr:DUF1275 domain-containing protein [Blastocatellia bacterium]